MIVKVMVLAVAVGWRDRNAVLKGDVKVMLREPSKAEPANAKTSKRGAGALTKTHTPLDLESERRFAALKAWRFEVARAHNLPAYVIFHDATLIAIAEQNPQALHQLASISGMGVKKLEAYGDEVPACAAHGMNLKLETAPSMRQRFKFLFACAGGGNLAKNTPTQRNVDQACATRYYV